MKNYSKLLAFTPSIAVAFILFILFSNLFFEANQFIFFGGGDALKNYYHFAAYVKYGSNFHLSQVNYPYGEHIIFLDNQPVLAFIAKQVFLSDYAVALIHLMPFVSLVFTAYIIFLIQDFLKLPVVLNILSSIIITLLSPQILRFESHHALAYTFIIPLIILLLLYAHRSKLYFIALAVLTIFVSFIHLYYLLIALLLVSAYSFIVLINRKQLSYFISAILSVSIPFIIFKFILKFTDNVLDRPETSLNTNFYRSTFEGVFIPHTGKYSEFLNTSFNLSNQNFESFAYIGKLALPILVFMLISLIILLVKRKNTIQLFENTYLFDLCWAAVLIWIFAMYYPLKGLIDFTGNYISAIKQFRSLGRLGWIFFYVFSFLISFKIFHFYKFIKLKFNLKIASLFLLIVFAIWSSDIVNNFSKINNTYQNYKVENIFNPSFSKTKNTILEQHIDFSKYQASLALPFFHIGSEIGNYEGSSLSIQEVFSLAYTYNLAHISTYSSRVSKTQFNKFEQLIESGKLENFNMNNKPFLVVADINFLEKSDSLIINKSKYLYNKDRLYYFEYSDF